VDSDTFVSCFPDFKLTPQEIDVWNRDQQAIIVGRATAEQMHWKVGDHISIVPSVPPYEQMEFHVISTAQQANDAVTNWFHRKYYEEVVKKTQVAEGMVSFFFVKCASKADQDQFRVAIDDLFRGTPDETKAQDEKSFMNEFISQQFNLPRNLSIL